MSENDVAAALARLDRAITRLESGFTTRAARNAGIAEAYAQLDKRHGLLRARIQDTIVRLDGMIEGAS